jgi:beta-glucanase (GH16 family)
MKIVKEYDFTTMTTLHPDWTVAVGEKWANKELQQYTDERDTLFFDDGLVLQAVKDGEIIKSARIHTKNKFFYRYGKIDIVAKIPSGIGTWPALWMMSNESKYGHWPKSGEIDIMEHSLKNPEELFFCLHTEAYNHRGKEQYYTIKRFPNILEGFHKFSLLWTEDKITYYVDDQEVVTYQKGENGKDATHKGWPFDEDFYLIMNLAIGGTFGGKVDMSCFPQQFIIKSVKIYQ